MDNATNSSFIGAGVNFYCDLKIKDKQIIAANIIHLCIKEWIFDIVPRIELILNDDGMLTEVYPLQDGDTISVKLKKPSDAEMLEMEFSLLSYTAGAMYGNKFMQLILVGVLKVKDFYSPVQYRSLHNLNSDTALRQIITSEGGRELITSAETTDTMTWLQTSTNMQFCKHILKRSFIANDCMLLFADHTGKFTYTSFKTEADKVQEGIARLDVDKYSADQFSDNADIIDYWYNTYSIYDYNPYVNATQAYGVSYNYYNTETGAQSKNISDNSTPLTALTAKDINNANTISQKRNMGYLTGDNMHPNYYDALIQNDYYKHNWLSGFMLELNINALSKPRLMSKVQVILPSLLGPGSNDAMSGEYIVAGVVHDAVKGEVYHKRMLLVRNGYDRVQETKKETLQKSTPTATTPQSPEDVVLKSNDRE